MRGSLREQKRNQIVQAAARVFAVHGFEAATVAQIAQEAQVGKGTIYEYFKSKHELIYAVFEWFMDLMSRGALDILNQEGGSPSQKLNETVEYLMAVTYQHHEFFGLVMEFWSAAIQAEHHENLTRVIKKSYAEFTGMFESLIKAGVDCGEFRPDLNTRALAVGLVAVLDGIALQAWFDNSIDPLAMGRGLLDSLMKGILTAQGGDET
jgi:AcrR family transcriptional regulator